MRKEYNKKKYKFLYCCILFCDNLKELLDLIE